MNIKKEIRKGDWLKMNIERMEKALANSADALGKIKGGDDNLVHAVHVLQCVCGQIVAHLKGENLDSVSNPDVCIHFEEDCCNGKD